MTIKNLNILEIGSGNGYFIEECKKSNIDITGSEADFEQYELLKKNTGEVNKQNTNKSCKGDLLG